MWRIRPRAQGRASWIQHRTSHVASRPVGRISEGSVGQKVHPYGFRVGTLYGWQSNWFAEKHYREAAPRGHQDPELHQEEAVSRWNLEGRDRPDGREDRRQHPHRAAGDPDRKARSRGRDAAGGARELLHAQGDLHQHQGDPKGRARRAARGRERRAAARAPRGVPPGHEEGGDLDHEVRCREASGSSARDAWAARRWVGASGTARVACRCTRCAPRSTTASPRRRRPTASIGVKCWIFKGEVADKDLRSGALSERAGGDQAAR